MARYFDMLEINTSFYGHIKPEWGKLWCRKARLVNPGFLFTAKLNRAFTHSPIAVVESTSADTIQRRRRTTSVSAKAGLDSIAEENMLGAVLVQFPISFKNTDRNRDYLDALLDKFSQYPLVSKSATTVGPTKAPCATSRRRTSPSAISISRCWARPSRPAQQVTSPIGYVRLHGRNYEQWFDSDSGNDRYNYLYTAAGTSNMEEPHRHRRRQGAEDLRRHQQSLRRQSRGQRVATQEHAHRRPCSRSRQR